MRSFRCQRRRWGNLFEACHTKEAFDGSFGSRAMKIDPTGIHIASLSDNVPIQDYDGVVKMSNESPPPTSSNHELSTNKILNVPPPAASSSQELSTSGRSILQVQCKAGKLGSRALRTQLETIISFIGHLFASIKSPNILIMCPDGRDLSIGVALTVLCLFYDDQKSPRETASFNPMNKTIIRQRLTTITLSKSDAHPSRATLQSVHAFLMPE